MRLLAAIAAAIAGALAACCIAAQPAPPVGLTLDQLMSSLAQRQHGEVSFAETDYLAILDRPVKSSGVLLYQAPAHLEKRTLQIGRASCRERV